MLVRTFFTVDSALTNMFTSFEMYKNLNKIKRRQHVFDNNCFIDSGEMCCLNEIVICCDVPVLDVLMFQVLL